MSNITASPDISNLKDLEEVKRFVDQFCHNVVEVVNGKLDPLNFTGKGLSLLQLKVSLVNVTFDTANTEVSVAHGLGQAPRGYIATSMDIASIIYNSGTTWTANEIFLKASVATHVDLLFFY